MSSFPEDSFLKASFLEGSLLEGLNVEEGSILSKFLLASRRRLVGRTCDDDR
jgi:hypothetical protein